MRIRDAAGIVAPETKVEKKRAFQRIFDGNAHGQRDPVKSLWRAVLLQIILDIGTKAKSEEAQFAKFEATNFIKSRKEDFYLICELADMSPETVRKVGCHIIENGLVWRAAPGEGKRYEERKHYRAKVQNRSMPRLRPAAMFNRELQYA